MSAEHGREFFEQMATCRDAYRRLGDAIHATLGPHRALDIGAGLGFVAGRLNDLGWFATASDLYAPEDLRDPRCGWQGLPGLAARWPSWERGFDAVICTEVAEHIEPGAEEVIVANVAGTARQVIVWSAAGPGQEWPGHVNLRPAAFWLGLFGRHGFDEYPVQTLILRDEMRERRAQHHHAADNFFVLGRCP